MGEASPAPAGTGEDLVIRARRLGLTTRNGRVFAGVNIDVPTGSSLIVRGPSRSGKTALLLAIAGRARVDEGELSVLGHDLRGRGTKVRNRVGLGEIRGVNDLEPALSVGHHVAERLALHTRWWRPWIRRGRVQSVLDRVNAAVEAAVTLDGPLGQDLVPLTPGTPVVQLHPVQRLLFGAALGLLGHPDLLVVDDVDAFRHERERRLAWRALEALVVATSAEHPVGAVVTCEDDADAHGSLWAHSAVRLQVVRPMAGQTGEDTTGSASSSGFPFPMSVPVPSRSPERADGDRGARPSHDRPGVRRTRA